MIETHCLHFVPPFQRAGSRVERIVGSGCENRSDPPPDGTVSQPWEVGRFIRSKMLITIKLSFVLFDRGSISSLEAFDSAVCFRSHVFLSTALSHDTTSRPVWTESQGEESSSVLGTFRHCPKYGRAVYSHDGHNGRRE